MDPRDPAALVAASSEKPNDARLRLRAADALAEAGRWSEAVRVLEAALVNVTAHDDAGQPCLCRRCLPREGGARPAIEQDGTRLRLEFAEAEGRVLYYWMPEELVAERRRVARSVAADLAQGLKKRPRRSE